MRRKILIYMMVFMFSGCYTFYSDIKPKQQVSNETYIAIDTSFILENYFVCSVNGRYDFIEITEKRFEDSLLTIFNSSMGLLDINIISTSGKNLISPNLCALGEMVSPRELLIFTDSLLENTNYFEKDKKYILPYFRLVDTAINTSFGTGNVYVNWFSAGVMVILIDNKKVIYSRFIHGLGVSDNKEKVTNDWPNYPSPPDVLYEQAHWDTLVGLAMEDYIKRLNTGL